MSIEFMDCDRVKIKVFSLGRNLPVQTCKRGTQGAQPGQASPHLRHTHPIHSSTSLTVQTWKRRIRDVAGAGVTRALIVKALGQVFNMKTLCAAQSRRYSVFKCAQSAATGVLGPCSARSAAVALYVGFSLCFRFLSFLHLAALRGQITLFPC